MVFTKAGLGRCAYSFWLAVVFDVIGLAVLLTGVFANVYFYDFLIYAGAIIIFLSLIWWVFWYTGNIEVPPEELLDDVGLAKKNAADEGVLGLVRRLSRRLSRSFRRSPYTPRSGASAAQPTNINAVSLPMASSSAPALGTLSASLDGRRGAPPSARSIHTSPI
ncbi:hypothetical protein NDU88_005867 [Pleurodeles waltl]|uniref:Uncharacterized protein n=1 Tax=Pleurodeles waltl TaxID=8319 RepID=A0AAV7TC76_PLEWA|nr:hypothetical protein NDU88_005867 [Pleurodeles waltl]